MRTVVVLALLAAAPATAAAADLTLVDNEFRPAELRAAAGSEVTVENAGEAVHTVTERASLFHVQVRPGATGTFVAPAQVGTYAFVCAYHDRMTGTLVVEEARPAVSVRTPGIGAFAAAALVAAAAFLHGRRQLFPSRPRSADREP